MTSPPAALARFATFTDAFLSGLVIPLIPYIIKTRIHAPSEQVQVLASVLVAAYGCALVAVSPLLPLVASNGRYFWVTVFGGLVCASAAFVLIQFYAWLPLLLLARALQGLSAAATNGACSATICAGASTWSWITPTVLQSAAMAVAPAVAGYLHDNVGGENSVFLCAYAVVAMNALLWLVVFFYSPGIPSAEGPVEDDLTVEQQQTGTYGTMSLRGGGDAGRFPTVSSIRSVSSVPSSGRSRRSSISSTFSAPDDTAPVFGIRLFTALFGYFVVAFLNTALQSIIPLLATRHFGWTVSTIGLVFVPMSGPAAVVGILAGHFTRRVPASARFVVAIGFLVCVAGFAHIGQFEANSAASAPAAVPLVLALFSFGIGHCGDPLFREILRLTADGSSGYLSATAVYAWGSFLGPLVTGFLHWGWGWYSMAKFLCILCGFASLFALVFLQGWIGNPPPLPSIRVSSGSDEESAPLLGDSSQRGLATTKSIGRDSAPRHLAKGDLFDQNNTAVTDSSEFGSSVRTDGERKVGKHRRHFSIDNFSIATTAVGLTQADQDGQQVRFQAALETPTLTGSSFKQQLGNPERRFVMREAPHAPKTDALLASGNRYVIDEAGADGETSKRHVVVFEEGAVPAELLERRQHHVVAINSTDGSVRLAPSTENHAVHVTEEAGELTELPETSRRYVVVLLEQGDIGVDVDA